MAGLGAEITAMAGSWINKNYELRNYQVRRNLAILMTGL